MKDQNTPTNTQVCNHCGKHALDFEHFAQCGSSSNVVIATSAVPTVYSDCKNCGKSVPNDAVCKGIDKKYSQTEVDQMVSQAVNKAEKITGDTSDGFHTFNELYEFRMLYNAHLFNEWGRHKTYPVLKSKRHADGQLCFGGGWFIVMAQLPSGQISNHYENKYWNLFDITAFDVPPWEFDGHTAQDVAKRLRAELNRDETPKGDK